MEQRKKHRKVLRTTFTKSMKELDELLSTPEGELRLIKVSLDIVRQKIEDLKQVDNEIYNLLLDEDVNEGDLLAEMEASDSYIKKFADLNSRCEERIQPKWTDVGAVENEVAASVISDGAVNSRTGRRKFKLPTLEFKKFDGNIKDWLSFWSQFQKVHDDPDIDLNDKVEYLIQAMVPGSRARQLVDSFPATGSNYSKIIDCLLARFGREDLQIEVYVRELLKLVINTTSSGNRIDLSYLYDKLESQLRALETLGITSDKYAAMLFPLVESCLPSDLLRVWQRLPDSPLSIGTASQMTIHTAGVSTIENRLRSLMKFLKNEVDNEQHVSLAVEGFNLSNRRNKDFRRGENKSNRYEENFPKLSTATGLINSAVTNKCIFCQNLHESASCFKAQKLSYDQKKDILTEKGACFRCLRIGHRSRNCRGRLKCIICGKSHVALMCPELSEKRQKEGKSDQKEEVKEDVMAVTHQTLTNSTNPHIFLQTLRVKMENSGKKRYVRALIDTGSQKTYILESTAGLLRYRSKRQVNIIHGLFGGSKLSQKHDCYDVTVSNDNYSCTFEALDQPVICNEVSTIFHGPWTEELRLLNIQISDSRDDSPIELLIGSDIAGKLYTGKRYVLKCGLVAIETLLGWTLMGKIPLEIPRGLSATSVSLFINNASITNLWELDVLGIRDPTERMTREETALAAKELFLETVTTDVDGRYEVRLPWLEGHPALPSNYQMAKKRLENTVKKIINDGYFEAYDQVFKDWLNENIIEEVFETQPVKEAHYLPHRPVIKPSSVTTKIRPVFDASAREKDSPSLNQCLEKGLNLIELIPDILLRFRRQKIGVVSDIRKAFLQISIHEADRDFLRFLWSNSEGRQIVYRHRRVVFGINSSPFLLGATIEYHLSKMLKKSDSKPFSKETIMKLSNGFYVDNCVTSVANDKELRTFIQESSIVMAEGKFDLRGWEHSYQVQDGNLDNSTPVLGIKWNKQDDTLSLNQDDKSIEQFANEPVTKRMMLSQAQRVFDPIGYTCPTTLIPKLLLQKTWEKQLTWDTPVDPVMETHFRNWIKELPYLSAIKIPRWIKAGPEEAEQWTLHTFCDASKDAFSAAVFLRGVQYGKVFIHLLAAKSRVAPLKTLSIPRLELMASVIAVRLGTMCKENLSVELDSFYWSDSTTVLSWIRRPEEWSTFVWNRVTEIRKASSDKNWHHVPGTLNPADLPSRGCSAKQLLESRWWEGPSWLYRDSSHWPQDNLHYNEDEINKEKRKRLVTVLVNSESNMMASDDWHIYYFSQYLKTLRMCAWILRFIHNAKNKDDKRKGDLSAEECDNSEILVLKLIQQESFANENDKKLHGLNAFKDNNGLIRLKTRISNRDDHENFRFPIVLPAKHSVVNRLVFREHVKLCHIGAQGLMSILRERHWILGGRRAVKLAISGCVVCKRYNAKPFDASSPPLPIDRVRDAACFEITGVDFAGPLYLKTGEKVWVCLFTCAVYRAVHLELCTSLSAADFMQALRRFIARRGRPRTIYSDNGTNFVGTENAFSLVDFQKVAEYSSAERIRWRFNPPTAAWWGGFWERLVGVLKQLLRKMLGRASLDYGSLATILCDCESVINSRPLTCPSSDANELVPLTPVMFLRDQIPDDVPDCDAVDQQSLSRKVLHRQKLLQDLRRRFRNEYLGQLKWWSKKNKENRVKVGEVVFVGNDQDKRVNWPLGRVIELIPGNDGQVRLVKVLTERGQFLRPIQRLYPLECATDLAQMEDGVSSEPLLKPEPPTRDGSVSAGAGVSKSRVHESKVTVTRSGRKVNTPVRYSDCL